MKKKFHLAICLCVLCATAYAAHDNPETFELHTQQSRLDNGLTVLITPMPSQPTVSLYALVKVGSAMEGPYLGAGISHFIEHMLFKGTARRGVGQISQEVQALGGTINASTSFDYTIFTLTVPADKFAQGLDILADMIMNPKFDSTEVEKERTVITKEIRLLKDQPERVLSEAVFDTVFRRHPYRIPIIGYEEVFLTLTRDDLVRFHSRYYIPNNIVVSIAGDVEAVKAMPQIGQAFQSSRRGRTIVRHLPPEPEQIDQRRREIEYPTPLYRLSMSYAGVSITDQDMFALDILALVLGHGKSSRLYQDLISDKQWIQSLQAVNYTPADRGVFEVECVSSEDNTERLIHAVKEHIAKIQKHGVSSAELVKARRQLLAQYVLEHQTSSDVAYQTAMDMAFAGDAEFSNSYLRAVEDITPDDIRRVAQKYLVDSGLSIVVLRPIDQTENKQTASTPVPSESIEVDQLDNGITLVLQNRTTVPWISMVAALKGGVAQEDPSLNGIAQLTAQTWNKGTRSRSAQEIAQESETRGISLGGFATHDGFGLALQCLPGEIDAGLVLFTDVLMDPVFPADEIDKVKDKMLTDIRSRQDNIFDFTFMKMREKLFPGYPMGRTGLGTEETVEKLTRQHAVDYYQDLMVGNNLVVTVIGDFPKDFCEVLKRRLSAIPTREMQFQKIASKPLPETVEQTIRMDKQQALVMLGFQGVGGAHADRYGLELLTALLGSSFQGRIFREIRDEFGQAYTLGGAFYPAWEEGLVFFYVTTTPAYVLPIKNMLNDIISSAAEEPFSEQELQDMKAYLSGRHQRGLQTYSALAFRIALDTRQGLGPEYYQDYDDQIQTVSSEDIQRLAREYLDLSHAVLVITNPPDESAQASETAPAD